MSQYFNSIEEPTTISSYSNWPCRLCGHPIYEPSTDGDYTCSGCACGFITTVDNRGNSITRTWGPGDEPYENFRRNKLHPKFVLKKVLTNINLVIVDV